MLHDEDPQTPCPRPFNLAAYVLAAGAAQPDKIALAILGPTRSERWSYARLTAAVRGTATGLLQLGLTPGDKVLMRIGNTVDFPLAYLGAITAGLVPIPTSAQLTAPEVANIVRDMRPSVILRDPECAAPDCDVPEIPLKTMRLWRDLDAADYAMGDPDRLAYVIYTSGTAGRPRAVGHAHRAIWARRRMMVDWYDLHPDDRMMHAGAFNWTYTLGTGLLDPWTLGATALIPAAGSDPAQIALLAKRHEATIFAAAPGVYRRLLRHISTPLPRLRHALSAGEKLPDSIRAAWCRQAGTEIHEAFGMSECSTFISGAPHRPAAPGALGAPQRGRRVAILGPEGPLEPGTPGVIAIHRDDPGLMLGYLDAPEDTAARFQGDWFLTGDEGVQDPAGQISYLGRADDMLNAGGYRVSPLEIERALLDHPAIQAAAAVERRVKQDVSVIAAYYEADGPIDPGTLSAHCAARLARYKQPRLFEYCPALPRNANGKIQRRALRDGP